LKIDAHVKSLQGRHSRVRGNDENGSFLTFYEFVNIEDGRLWILRLTGLWPGGLGLAGVACDLLEKVRLTCDLQVINFLSKSTVHYSNPAKPELTIDY